MARPLAEPFLFCKFLMFICKVENKNYTFMFFLQLYSYFDCSVKLVEYLIITFDIQCGIILK